MFTVAICMFSMFINHVIGLQLQVSVSGQRRRPNYTRYKTHKIDKKVQKQGLTIPLVSEESQESVQEDMQIIESDGESSESDELSQTEEDSEIESDFEFEQSKELNDNMIERLHMELEIERVQMTQNIVVISIKKK